jgi:hypothetical protein
MRHVLRRCFAEMWTRESPCTDSSEEKRLDLIATESRPCLHSHHALSLTDTLSTPHLAL